MASELGIEPSFTSLLLFNVNAEASGVLGGVLLDFFTATLPACHPAFTLCIIQREPAEAAGVSLSEARSLRAGSYHNALQQNNRSAARRRSTPPSSPAAGHINFIH